MGSPVWTLAAVIVGAAMSYVVTLLNDRARYRREVLTRWDERRLEVYSDYVYAVEQLTLLTRRIMAAKGFEISPRPKIDLSHSTELLDEAESKRALKFVSVTLLGDPATINAGHDLNQEVWRLEWIARERVTANQDEWDAANNLYRTARKNFYDNSRRALGVLGSSPPRPDRLPFDNMRGPEA